MKLCCVYFNLFTLVKINTYHNLFLNNRNNLDKHFSDFLNPKWESIEEKYGSVKKERNRKYRRDLKNKSKDNKRKRAFIKDTSPRFPITKIINWFKKF